MTRRAFVPVATVGANDDDRSAHTAFVPNAGWDDVVEATSVGRQLGACKVITQEPDPKVDTVRLGLTWGHGLVYTPMEFGVDDNGDGHTVLRVSQRWYFWSDVVCVLVLCVGVVTTSEPDVLTCAGGVAAWLAWTWLMRLARAAEAHVVDAVAAEMRTAS